VNPVTYELVGPPGLISGVTLVKAMPGDTIDIYATGFGKTSPAVSPGEIPNYRANTVEAPEVVAHRRAPPTECRCLLRVNCEFRPRSNT